MFNYLLNLIIHLLKDNKEKEAQIQYLKGFIKGSKKN